MRLLRTLQLSVCAVLLCMCVGTSVRADGWNKKTIVTFGDYVEIPGQVLPPGTYVFKLFDSASNRHIVQIWNEDENQIFATIMAIPSYRYETPDRVIFEFDERPGDSPLALRAWFYPGDSLGNEFVYHYNYHEYSNAAGSAGSAR